jgi:hypothetical protein
MSRKHNTKHNRSMSKYPERLAARGKTSASVRMRVLTERDTYKLLHPEKETNIENMSGNPDIR